MRFERNHYRGMHLCVNNSLFHNNCVLVWAAATVLKSVKNNKVSEIMLGLILPVILLGIFIYKWIFKRAQWPANMPDGPPAYPVIGSLIITKYSHPILAFEELHKQYGKSSLICLQHQSTDFSWISESIYSNAIYTFQVQFLVWALALINQW